MRKYILCTLPFFLAIVNLSAQVCTLAAGTTATSWIAGPWSCTSVPLIGPPSCAQKIIINGTFNISEDVNYTSCTGPMQITINGTLNFTKNGDRITLPAGSTITASGTGRVTKGWPGGGNSTNIVIGSTIVWQAANGNQSGPFIWPVGAIILPIELLKFTAKPFENKVSLEWVTTSQYNNDYFTLEKTLDGIEFKPVATINGFGTNQSALNYKFTDSKPYSGTSYYRLKQTDFDGKYSYSSLEKVEMAEEDDFSFDVYPNPSNGENIHVDIHSAPKEEVLVVVTDISGKENYSKVHITENKGDNVYAVDPSGKLSPGIYIITATSHQHIHSKKMIVR